MISEKTSHRKIAHETYINYNCAMVNAEREINANSSKFHPAGGWGTQPDAWLWNKIGKRIEKLGKTTKNGK